MKVFEPNVVEMKAQTSPKPPRGGGEDDAFAQLLGDVQRATGSQRSREGERSDQTDAAPSEREGRGEAARGERPRAEREEAENRADGETREKDAKGGVAGSEKPGGERGERAGEGRGERAEGAKGEGRSSQASGGASKSADGEAAAEDVKRATLKVGAEGPKAGRPEASAVAAKDSEAGRAAARSESSNVETHPAGGQQSDAARAAAEKAASAEASASPAAHRGEAAEGDRTAGVPRSNDATAPRATADTGTAAAKSAGSEGEADSISARLALENAAGRGTKADAEGGDADGSQQNKQQGQSQDSRNGQQSGQELRGEWAAVRASQGAESTGANRQSDSPAALNLMNLAMQQKPEGEPTGGTLSSSVLTAAASNSGGNGPVGQVGSMVTGEALPTPTSSSDGEAQRVAEQALRGIRGALNQRGGSVTLQLSPPELGSLRVRVEMQGTVVRAQIEAATESAKSALSQQLTMLKGALESHGLTVEQLQVQTQGANQSSTARDAGANEQDGRGRGEQRQPQQESQQNEDDHDEQQRRFQRLLDLVG